MHLLSSNGPIEVLVCPEGDTSTSSSSLSSSSSSSLVNTPIKISSPSTPREVSLGSTVPVHDADLDGLFPPTGHHTTTGVTHFPSDSSFIPADVFESLSPPLNEGDFYSSLSPTEGILELFDLA